MKKITKTGNYLRHMLEGPDNKLSGKRVLGTLLILFAMWLGWYGMVYYDSSQLGNVSIIAGTFLGAGLAFWGITSWSTMKEQQMNQSSSNISTLSTTANSATTTSDTITATTKEEIK